MAGIIWKRKTKRDMQGEVTRPAVFLKLNMIFYKKHSINRKVL